MENQFLHLKLILDLRTPRSRFHPHAMPDTQSQARILAQGIYEMRLLLSGFLGSQNNGDPAVRRAAHLAYALHNEALSVIEGRTFDGTKAMAKVRAVDGMFGENFALRFEKHISSEA